MTIPKDYKTTRGVVAQIQNEIEDTLAKYALKYAKDSGSSNALIRQFCFQINSFCDEFAINMWLTKCICAPVKEKDL